MVVQPLNERREPSGEPHVAVDVIGANRGEVVFVVSRREGIEALPGAFGPAGAAVVGIGEQGDVSGSG